MWFEKLGVKKNALIEIKGERTHSGTEFEK